MEDFESNSRVSESETGKNGIFSVEKYGKCAEENDVSASKSLSATSSSQVELEQTSPDSLTNTPSNIARLEDMIEHCKGRRKYLLQTRSPSDGEDVRWYFCKVPLLENQLAASIPQTEIVGKSEYFRFSMRDSLALEVSFLQREEELLSCWWKEYAECSEGPNGPSISSVDSSGSASKPCSSKGDQSSQSYAIVEERVGVPVKGGLYEVDLAKRHCFPVYWSGENRRVLRGHWFACKSGLEWLPLRENVAEQLEFAYRCQIWHRRTFQPSGLFAARIDLQSTIQGLHALFTGEDDTWEAWLGVDNSGFSHVIGRGNGIKLRRGFSSSGSLKTTQDELRQQKEEEMDDYCSQVPVRHLIFMVHGIGQRLEKANLVDDVATFRHITASLAEQHLTSYQRGTQRVLFIPCQWRRSLKLGGESTVEKITLDGVRGLRVMLSATVHDVLYYMSPIYCQDIIDSVSSELNRLYMKFIKRNPGYDGKVSIYGHSLGSVLSFDILCHQESLSSPFPMDYLCNVGKGDSLVQEANQSTELISAVNSGSANDARNANTSEELVESVKERDNSSPQLDDEKNTGVLSAVMDSFPMSHMEPDSLKSGDFPNQVEVSCSHVEQTVDFKLCRKMTLSAGDSQELDRGSGDLFSPQGDSLDAELNQSKLELHGAVDKMADVSGDVGGKDKLTSLLREEIESLKARIAELELRQVNSLLSFNNGEHRGEGCHQGEADKAMSKQSSLGKVSLVLDSRQSYTPYIQYTKLNFKVDTFFAVGSPLGVFLALRNIRIGIGEGQEYWQDERITEAMPACRRMFNIFHPFDPVAYRVEPLISKEYISKRPVIIPYHKGGKRLHISFQEFTEDLAARSQSVMSRLNSMRVQMVNVFQPKKDKKEAIEDVQETETRTYGSNMMASLTGNEDGRIDHMLQDATFEHAYISAIGSHTSYWRDYDTALFILKHLYRDIAGEPQRPNSKGELKDRTSVGRRSYRSEVMDEENLPLTFSDRELIKEFSRKASKAMKAS